VRVVMCFLFARVTTPFPPAIPPSQAISSHRHASETPSRPTEKARTRESGQLPQMRGMTSRVLTRDEASVGWEEDFFVVASRTWCNEVKMARIDHGMKGRGGEVMWRLLRKGENFSQRGEVPQKTWSTRENQKHRAKDVSGSPSRLSSSPLFIHT
jgi:hypothetical protein